MTQLYVTGVYDPAAFEKTLVLLRAAGYTASAPHEYDGELSDHLDILAETLVSSDGVVAMTGWEHSPAAVIELTMAAALGIPAYSLQDALLGV